MATDLEKFREKYPQYNDLSDKQVADNLHASYPEYSKKDFYTKVGLKPKSNFVTRTDRAGLLGIPTDVIEGVSDTILGIPSAAHGIAKGLGQTAAQAVTDPLRLTQNVFGGIGELSNRAFNLPNATNQYLQSRGLTNPNSGVANVLKALTIPNAPREWKADDSEFTKILKSIHLPKAGSFDYAQGFGKKDARFKEEAEADEFIKEAVPATVAGAVGGLSGLALNELGAERNPYGVLAFPALKTAIKTAPKVGKTVSASANKVGNKAYETGRKTIGYKTQPELVNSAGEIAKNVADNLVHEQVAKAKTHGTKVIESLFEETKKKGITKAEIKKPNVKQMFEIMDPKQRAIVSKAFKTGNLRDIHEASKMMRSYAFELGAAKKINPELRTRVYQAKSVATNLENALKGAFEKAKPGSSKAYLDFKKDWQRNVIHAEQHPLFKEYHAGRLTPEQFIKDLSKNKTWLARNVGKSSKVTELARVLKEMQELPLGEITTPEINQLNTSLSRHNLIKNLPRKAVKAITRAVVANKVLK